MALTVELAIIAYGIVWPASGCGRRITGLELRRTRAWASLKVANDAAVDTWAADLAGDSRGQHLSLGRPSAARRQTDICPPPPVTGAGWSYQEYIGRYADSDAKGE
jgi:hypothetical protein